MEENFEETDLPENSSIVVHDNTKELKVINEGNHGASNKVGRVTAHLSVQISIAYCRYGLRALPLLVNQICSAKGHCLRLQRLEVWV